MRVVAFNCGVEYQGQDTPIDGLVRLACVAGEVLLPLARHAKYIRDPAAGEATGNKFLNFIDMSSLCLQHKQNVSSSRQRNCTNKVDTGTDAAHITDKNTNDLAGRAGSPSQARSRYGSAAGGSGIAAVMQTSSWRCSLPSSAVGGEANNLRAAASRVYLSVAGVDARAGSPWTGGRCGLHQLHTRRVQRWLRYL